MGQLGIGSREDAFSPIMVAGPWALSDTITIVSSGCDHTLVLTQSGKLFGMGSNLRRQLGKNESTIITTPVELTEVMTAVNEKISSVYTGCDHSMLLTISGKLYTFGSNVRGQLCNRASGGFQHIPQLVTVDDAPPNAPISQVAPGESHLIFLMRGRVYSCGSNRFGQLGRKTDLACFNKPSLVTFDYDDDDRFKRIYAGYWFNMAMINDNEAYVWGNNENS